MRKSRKPNMRAVGQRARLSSIEQKMINDYRANNEEERVLIIGDTHCPFDMDTYIDFLEDTYNKYRCNRVVHIGDELDHHYSSYHETDANGLGGGDELAVAKTQSGGIPREWMREYNDVLGVPNWNFHTEMEIDGVLYAHGEGGTARGKCKNDLQSVVQGHLHTQMYVEYVVGRNNRVFGMQVGCGINHDEYAFGYAKAGKKPAIGCGVVIGGKEAIVVPMLMENYKNGSRHK